MKGCDDMEIGGRTHNTQEIHEVASLGYPYAEICLYDPQEVMGRMDALLEIKKHYSIYYLAHYPNEDNPLDPDVLKKRFVPRMKELVDLSRILGITKGTIHFSMDMRWIDTEIISRKMDLLKEMVDYAQARDVLLCIENLSEGYESFVPVLDDIPALGMTLDIGHAQLLGKTNKSFGFMEHLFGQIMHVHVHDNCGGSSVKDDLHLGLGQGIVDYQAILSRLRQRGYDSTVTMEVNPKDMPSTRMEILRCMGQP